MNSALVGLRSPATAVLPPASSVAPIDSGMAKTARSLIWVYLILWIVEGALRKWFLVSLSDVLLVVRDPVVLAIYAAALIGGFFPFNAFFLATIFLAAASGMAGFVVIPDLPAVVAFGLRANFLHLPLIFVMGRVLRPKDLKWMGLLFMAGAIPQVILMAKQYRSGLDSWWNLGAGGGRQIEAARDVIRPAGTFSFISGPIFYFAITTAFVLGGLTLRNWTRWWLLIPVTGSCFLAAAVSGSRSLLISGVIVVAMFLIGCAVYPRAIKSLAKLFLVGLVGFAAVAGLNVYQTGRDTTTTRATLATATEGGVIGVAWRALGPIQRALASVTTAGFLGSGLGLGTNGGAALAGFRGDFLVAEDEWSRAIGESGPLIGLSYMMMRVSLAFWAFLHSLKAARRGNLLPLALLGAAGPGLVLGQFGQPTSLGATVFTMGLWVASLNLSLEDTIFVETQSAVTSALNSAKTPTPTSQPLLAAPASASRETPFNVARPRSIGVLPDTAPPPPPEPVPDAVINKPAYNPGRFAIKGGSSKSAKE
jgi:hypothetical protein